MQSASKLYACIQSVRQKYLAPLKLLKPHHATDLSKETSVGYGKNIFNSKKQILNALKI